MKTTQSCLRALLLCAAAAPCSFAYAHKDFREVREADPQGSVELFDLAGSVELGGWDRPEVEVTGTADDGDRIRITTSGSQTTIRVGPRIGGDGDEKRLVIHVPATSAVAATLVSANLNVSGIDGDANLRTVSGNLSGEVGGNLLANTATGDVRMTARKAKSIEVKTISGEVRLKGGSGEVEVATVNGDAKIELGAITRGRFKSISGNLTANLALVPDADLQGESVSGTIRLEFATAPAADFDVQSFSGNIDSCFGPKAEKAGYGPSTRLEFKSGTGQARVRIETKSGDVHLCAADDHGASAPAAASRR